MACIAAKGPSGDQGVKAGRYVGVFFLVPVGIRVRSVIRGAGICPRVGRTSNFPLSIKVASFILPGSRGEYVEDSSEVELFNCSE